MSTKTYFKRISLAVIFALTFGAFSSAPSQAVLSGSASLTLSAATDSKVVRETSTVTITASFTANLAGETFIVKVNGAGATNQESTVVLVTTTDSLNITSGYTLSEKRANLGDSLTATSADALTRVKITLSIREIATVGTHVYNVNLYDRTNALIASTPYTLTVTAANSTATAAQSQLFLNEVLPTSSTYTMSDSLNLVKSAGQTSDLSLMTPTRVAYLGVNFRNSAGESVVSTTGSNVDGTMIVKITSGPGTLSKESDGLKVRQLSVSRGETITIWNDGSSGVTTITGYIGTTPLTQDAKTITFYGKATSFVATANAVTAAGWN